MANENDADELSLFETQSGPAFALLRDAKLSDYTFVYESPEERDRRLYSSYDYFDADYSSIVNALPDGENQVQRLPDRPPHTGTEVWAAAIGLTAAAWQLLGLPGALQLGEHIRKWLKAKKGRSGNVGALLPVAIRFIHDQIPDSQPDLGRVQVVDPCKDSRYPVEYQVVFLYRIYDKDGSRVYLVEVDSIGTLVHLTQRQVGMFEGGSGDRSRVGA